MAKRWLAFLAVVVGSALLTACLGGGGAVRYTVTGYVMDGQQPQQGIQGVLLEFGSFGGAETEEDGRWSKSGLRGSLRIEPHMDGYVFVPPYRQVSGSLKDIVFTGWPRILDEIQQVMGTEGGTLEHPLYVGAPSVSIPPRTLGQDIEISFAVLPPESVTPFNRYMRILGYPVRLNLGDATSTADGAVTLFSSELVADGYEAFVGYYLNGVWILDEVTVTAEGIHGELSLHEVRLLAGLHLEEDLEYTLAFLVIEPQAEVAPPNLQVWQFDHAGNRWLAAPSTWDEEWTALLVHGFPLYRASHTDLLPLAVHLAEQAEQREVSYGIYAVRYPLGYGIRYTGEALARILAERLPRESQIQIIAHSMGGLVSRAAVHLEGAADKVQSLMTLGTPHLGVPRRASGTLLANVGSSYWTPELTDMEAHSQFLSDLNASTAAEPNRPFYGVIAGTCPMTPSPYWLGDESITAMLGMLLEVPHDGVVEAESALGYAWWGESHQLPLNHTYIRLDPLVFSHIDEWLVDTW